ncbi:unnamed protein product [marine sediment metagenome]|uniref:Uncharacterized protein n=1 Tax=marine sediment metagenome TaxID=412755 RepID=X1FFE4_9ZZZZ
MMKKHISISDEEYNDILQWLKEEVDIETESLCEEQIIAMKDTFSFQRWQLKKAYREFATIMRETRLGSILITIIERIDRIFEKIFC